MSGPGVVRNDLRETPAWQCHRTAGPVAIPYFLRVKRNCRDARDARYGFALGRMWRIRSL
ncbi:hypothetical protein VMCG_02625 [Cytospora schulzeri]|uniref:Uncharacterized protein n=1 Tax=Cytospora schulzeri TaxID=448051 RepID=A0A423X1P2_9PEZI|nr:hypothetical protein VMCG_02625 [Valsa malicola]